MPDLLSFNPYRNLEFDSRRPLEFDSQRPLEFNSGRALEFQPNRDLGFGRRGVVFRGFVCPICGSLVTEDAKRCSECGAVFDPTPRAAGPAEVTTAPTKSAKPGAVPAKAGVSPASTVYCAHCGVKVKRTDTFCWNCGAKTSGSSEAAKPAGRTTPPVSREWRPGR
jgi:hypothetical protein